MNLDGSTIKMGKLPEGFQGKNITFCVTEDCNLACKYCYMAGKNGKKKMTFEVAKRAVDYILTNKEFCDSKGVIWDFIGGEPLMEIELIDKISDYIKLKMFELDHHWFNSFRFSMSSNGLLYNTPKVQNYINKNSGYLSLGLSVDGNKTKHDLQRVKLDGSGSYDDVVKNVPLWKTQFPNNTTKATFSQGDLVHLKDSIIDLWNIGIDTISANVVFEDVWQEGDDEIFEDQLMQLADYIIDNELWDKYSVRFFDPNIGFPLKEADKKKNFCGAGRMLAIDCDGNFFPCIRFLDFALSNKPGVMVGNIDEGINKDKVRPFEGLTMESQSKDECINCKVASGCAWCTGNNYDLADIDTIYQRITFNCKMHKANVRANKYFWNRYTEKTGKVSPRTLKEQMEQKEKAKEEMIELGNLLFITDDNVTPHCSYKNYKNLNNKMDVELIMKGIEFATKNNFTPVFLGEIDSQVMNHLNELNLGNTLTFLEEEVACGKENTIPIYCNKVKNPKEVNNEFISVLLISKDSIANIENLITDMSKLTQRINIVVEDLDQWEDKDVKYYKEQLDKITPLIVKRYKENNPLQINVLTDRLYMENMNNCDAGNNTFTLAPNGKIYICPAFYFDDEESYIGDLENGIHIEGEELLSLEKAPLCSRECDAYHCLRCKFLNVKLTGEINTPSRIQCIVSHHEREVTRRLQIELLKKDIIISDKIIPIIDYDDPLEKINRRIRY